MHTPHKHLLQKHGHVQKYFIIFIICPVTTKFKTQCLLRETKSVSAHCHIQQTTPHVSLMWHNQFTVMFFAVSGLFFSFFLFCSSASGKLTGVLVRWQTRELFQNKAKGHHWSGLCTILEKRKITNWSEIFFSARVASRWTFPFISPSRTNT